MKKIPVKTNFIVKPLGLLVALALGVSSRKPPKLIAESEYAAKIVGNWLGEVSNMSVLMTLKGDGSFIARLRPRGFISNTLVSGTIRGTWTIKGKTITLRITSAEDERVKDRVTSSTILAFDEDELSLKSDRDETSTFSRTLSP